jgi:hypothetical protein
MDERTLEVGKRYQDVSENGGNATFILISVGGYTQSIYYLIDLQTGEPYSYGDPADVMIDAFCGDEDDFIEIKN